MQVRIDDDVIPLLEASKAAHGGSLSKAANRLLRASASKPRVIVTTGSTHVVNQGINDALGNVRIPIAPQQAKRVGRCSHPLLRRIGSACAVCGATIG